MRRNRVDNHIRLPARGRDLRQRHGMRPRRVRHAHLLLAARADDDKHPQRAEPRRHLPPDAPVARHQRRLAHQRPLFDPHHRCQRAFGRQTRVFAQKCLVLLRANHQRRLRQLLLLHVAARQHRAAGRNQREHALPLQPALRRNQPFLPEAPRPRQHDRLCRRHFVGNVRRVLDVQRLPARAPCGQQRPAHPLVPAKGNQSHVHPSRR